MNHFFKMLNQIKIFIIFILIFCCIWFLAPTLQIMQENLFSSIPNRLIGFFLIVFLYSIFRLIKINLKAKNFTKNPELAGFIIFLKQFKKNYFTAKNNLKQKNLVCYLVLGPRNAGKTSLINSLEKSETTQQFNLESKFANAYFTKAGCFIEIKSNFLSETQDFLPYLQILKYKLQPLIHGSLFMINPQSLTSFTSQHKKYQSLFALANAIAHTINQNFFFIFNKTDMLTGFIDFFADLSREAREQTLGMKFPDQFKNFNQLFELQFNLLLETLNKRALWRMQQISQPSICAQIKNFPQQIAIQKNLIHEILKNFDLNSLKLRGIYFLSSQQNQIEMDFIKSSIEQNYQLVQANTPKHSNPSRQYFMQQLFHDILQTNLSHPSVYSTSYLISVAVISAAILFSGVFYLSYSVNANRKALSIVHQALQNPANQSLDQKINLIAQAENHLTQTESNNLLEKMDSNHALKIKLSAAYQHLLDTTFASQVNTIFIDQLNQEKNPADLYQSLKAYLMFNQQIKMDPPFLENYFSNYFSQRQLATPVGFLQKLNQFLISDKAKLAVNQVLVNKIRNQLSQLPLPQLILAIAQSETAADPNLPKPVQSIFSQANAAAVYETKIPNAVKQLFTADAVLGVNQPENLNQLQTIVTQTQADYLQTYITQWQTVITNLTQFNLNNLNQAQQFTQLLAENLQPILFSIKNNTELDNPNFTLIQQHFASFDQAIGSSQLKTLQSQLETLNLLLNRIINSSNPNQTAFAIAKARFNNQQTDVIDDLLKTQNLPLEVNQLIAKLANQSWQLIMAAAKAHIEADWQTQVMPIYEAQINNHYPFAPSAITQVTAEDFTNFFGYDGVMQKFLADDILAFVETNGLDWQLKTKNNLQLAISTHSLNMLIRANLIYRMFFNANHQLNVSFALEPIAMRQNVKQFYLNINGEQISYPSNKTFNYFYWPNQAVNFASLALTDQAGKIKSKNYQGFWAWYQLFSKAAVTETKNPRIYQVIFQVDDLAAKYRLITTKVINPFLPDMIARFYLSNTL